MGRRNKFTSFCVSWLWTGNRNDESHLNDALVSHRLMCWLKSSRSFGLVQLPLGNPALYHMWEYHVIIYGHQSREYHLNGEFLRLWINLAGILATQLCELLLNIKTEWTQNSGGRFKMRQHSWTSKYDNEGCWGPGVLSCGLLCRTA